MRKQLGPERKEILGQISILQEEILTLHYHDKGLKQLGVFSQDIKDAISTRKLGIDRLKALYADLASR